MSLFRMVRRKKRKKTFRRWPKGDVISSDELTDAGFFYTGMSDVVQCFTCDVTVSDWRHGDVALERHLHHFPDCAFARNAYYGPQHHPTDAPVSASVANDDDQTTTQPIQETSRTGRCMVCRMRGQLVRLVACNHSSLCELCNRDRNQKRCPQCDEPIKAFYES